MGLVEPRVRHEVTVSHRRKSTYTLECTHDGRGGRGSTFETAHQRMESREHAARIVLAARLMGRVNELTAEQVIALVAARAAQPDVQSRSTARTSRRGKA